MLFSELSKSQLISKINQLNVHCENIFLMAFCKVVPSSPTQFELKQRFKSPSKDRGFYSEYHANLLEDSKFVDRAWQNLQGANYYGDFYLISEASLKCHISLNDISNVNEEVIFGLVTLLKNEAESVDNNLSFFFKIIDPTLHDHHRFSQNDQFTIYFDKYSSLGDMLDLAKKVDEYLQQHLIQNTRRLGEKDSCDINSFVSARLDINRLLSCYDVYPFFDLEIKKLLTKYSADELRGVPLCAIEAVFNYVVTADDITIPAKWSKEGLSAEDSKKVQGQFELMIANPARYLGDFDIQEISEKKVHPIKVDPPSNRIDFQSKMESLTEMQASAFGLNMHTLGMAMKIMGGIAVALGLIALCLASFGSPLMIAGAVTGGIGIVGFAGGFFVSKYDPKDMRLDTSASLTVFEQ